MTVTAAEGHLVSSDGLKLYFRRWPAPQPRAICLLVHGIAEHSGRYGHLAEALTHHRFDVLALDHRGHGRSEGRRGDCRSFRQFVEDLHLLAGQARAQISRMLPMALVGHSLGGLIALTYAAAYPTEVNAVAVSSPALKLTHETPPLKVSFVTAVSRVLPEFHFRNGVNPRHLCRDPAVVRAYETDPLVHRVLSARCAVALRQAMLRSQELAKEIRIPCLILQAGADELCDPRASEQFARSGSDPQITFRRYEGMYHELFNEPEKGRVIADLCAWLDEVIRSC